MEGWDQRAGLVLYLATGNGIALLGGAMRTARRRAERAKEAERVQRERLHVTLKSIGNAVVATDAEGRVTFLNPVAQDLTGWTADDAVGAPLERVFNIVNETTRRTVENPALRALKEGVVVGLANHTVLIAKDGTERPIDDTAAPIRDRNGTVAGVVLVFRDATERKRAEAELTRFTQAAEQQRRIYETILSNTADFNYVFDPRGRFVYVNKPLLALWGKELHEAVGKDFLELDYPPDLAERLQRQIQSVIDARRPLTGETPYTSAAGERQYEYIFVPVLGAGGRSRRSPDRPATSPNGSGPRRRCGRPSGGGAVWPRRCPTSSGPICRTGSATT